MSESEPDSERLSRQEAAERLTDVAYALMTGGDLRLNGHRQLRVPIADEIVLKRNSRTNGDLVELELVLSWSTTNAQI